MSFQNTFYTALSNRSAVELSSLTIHDVVPATFVPVTRHAITQRLAELVFTDDLEHSQRLISLTRLCMAKGDLCRFAASLDGGLRVEEIENEYQKLNQPVTDTGKVISHKGRINSDYFRSLRLSVLMDGNDVSVLDAKGDSFKFTSVVTDTNVIISFLGGECSLTCNVTDIPFSATWSSIPSRMLVSFVDNIDMVSQLLKSMKNVPTVLSANTVQTLIETAVGEVSTYAMGVCAILIAGSTAHSMGLTTI